MSGITDAQLAIAGTPQVWALQDLRDNVIAQFASDGLSVDQPFGWREKARQLEAAQRIVWVPGDEAGNMGRIQAARQPGRNPRPLLTLVELFHVEITGWDPTAPDDELAQYRAARALHDNWLRAVWDAAEGTFEIVSQRWPLERVESRFGLSAVVTGAIQSMIPDESDAVLPANAWQADMALSELSITEHETAP